MHADPVGPRRTCVSGRRCGQSGRVLRTTCRSAGPLRARGWKAGLRRASRPRGWRNLDGIEREGSVRRPHQSTGTRARPRPRARAGCSWSTRWASRPPQARRRVERACARALLRPSTCSPPTARDLARAAAGRPPRNPAASIRASMWSATATPTTRAPARSRRIEEMLRRARSRRGPREAGVGPRRRCSGAHPDPSNSLENPCVHRSEYGTRSSTVLAVGPDRRTWRYADGAPCETKYDDFSRLLDDLPQAVT